MSRQRERREPVPIDAKLRAEADRRGVGGQASLAREIGVSEANMSRWCSGDSLPHEARAAAIAAAIPGEDKESVLASIRVARQAKYEKSQEEARRTLKDERIEILEATVVALTDQMQDLHRLVRQLAEGGPDEPPRGHGGRR